MDGPATGPSGTIRLQAEATTRPTPARRAAGPAICTSPNPPGRPAALAESQVRLYKAELIRPEGPWRGVEHVELETLNWVDFFNNERPHETIHDLTPVEAEELLYAARNQFTPTG